MFQPKRLTQTGPSVIKQLRRRYRETWNREWPHDDKFLGELWQEARVEVPGQDYAKHYELTLIAMRENHEFEAA